MRSLADDGYHSIACNMRGYSVGARPTQYEAYMYDEIASDVTALADAFGMNKYHLVGHDHGACLSWYVRRASERTVKTIRWDSHRLPN
jgi:pimeloyl-ACP methyl ester carboxylesterase